MAKQLQNAQTICGNRLGLDTENDDIMIWVTARSWSPVPDNDQETVCWFEPFVDEVSPVKLIILLPLGMSLILPEIKSQNLARCKSPRIAVILSA